jgi:hypothetical protein
MANVSHWSLTLHGQMVMYLLLFINLAVVLKKTYFRFRSLQLN